MPSHVTNILEVKADGKKLDEIIACFGTHVNAQLDRSYEGEIICKNKNPNECRSGFFNEKTGIFTYECEERIGVPDGWDFKIINSFLIFPDFEKVIPPPDDPSYRDEPNQKVARTSPNWWKTWNIENWGTKWGGYDYERPFFNVFVFKTAWSGAPKIIEKISQRFPDVEFIYTIGGEGNGYVSDTFGFKDGKIFASPRGKK